MFNETLIFDGNTVVKDNSSEFNHYKNVYLRPVLDSIHNNPGATIIRYAGNREGLISLAQGESDYATPEYLKSAMIKAIAQDKTRYSHPLGLPEMRIALSEYYKNIYEMDIPARRMVITPSGTTAVHLAATAICDKGHEIIAVTPIWKNLLGIAQLQETNVKEVSLDFDDENGWQLDLNKLFDAVTSKTRVMLINSPNNPTGWIMSESDMQKVMDFARKRGIWIISDEVYGRLAYGMKRAPSFLDVAEKDDRLIVVNSFSKNWAMTGWRLGWMVIPEEAEQKIFDIVLYDYMCPQTFSQYAAIEALTNGEDFIKEQMEWYDKARNMVVDALGDIDGMKIHKSDATFYSFFKYKKLSDCMEFCKRLVDQQNVCLAPGCSFGKDVHGYIRMCFALNEPRLADALDRVRKFALSV